MPRPFPRLPRPGRPALVALAALSLLVAAAPFVPRGSEGPPAATQAASPQTAAPADWRSHGADHARAGRRDRPGGRGWAGLDRPGRRTAAADAARCAVFAGERYCLGLGWTGASEQDVPAPGSGRRRRRPGHGTGGTDRGPGRRGLLARRQPRTPAERAEADRARADRRGPGGRQGVELRAEIQGRALPDGCRAARGKPGPRRTPDRASILTSRRAREQNITYWCGPATMQAIGWGWQEQRKNQSYWARRLGTTTAGTAITDMVRVVNNNTDYDEEVRRPLRRARHQRLQFKQWYRLMMRHIHDYQAPVVLHPVAAHAVLPLPRRRRVRPLPGRPRLRPEPGAATRSSATSSRGTSSASTPASRPSPACSGATPTTRTAPTRPTSSTTSASDVPPAARARSAALAASMCLLRRPRGLHRLA